MSEGEFEKVQQAAHLIEGRTTLRPRIGLVVGNEVFITIDVEALPEKD